jgi:hypothetical protein
MNLIDKLEKNKFEKDEKMRKIIYMILYKRNINNYY